MWVRFTKPFDWRIPETGNRSTIAFKPGTRFVRKEAGEAAIEAGAAVKASNPRKKADDEDDSRSAS